MVSSKLVCSCIAEKKQDPKCEMLQIDNAETLGGSLEIYKVYCATCKIILDIVYFGSKENTLIVSLAANEPK